MLEDRAFALLVILLALPNCLPMPPPIPLICGLLMLFVAVQMVMGRRFPWLPKALLSRSIAKVQVDKAVERAIPLFRRLERWSRPRFEFLQHDWAIRFIGVLLCAVALALLGAPPLVGQIPLGFAACLIGLGLVERDGVAVVIGVVLGAMGAALSFSFFYAIVTGLTMLSGAVGS